MGNAEYMGSYGGYYGKRDAEPTAVAEAEADPYYGSYGYGGYGLSYGRTYGGYGLSYGRRYGGYGLSYGGLYSRGYYGKREAEAEADPTFRKRRKNKRRPSYRRSYGHSHSYSYEPTYTRSYTRSYPVSYRTYSTSIYSP